MLVKNHNPTQRAPQLYRVGLRLVLFAALWAMLSGGDLQSWVVGAPVVGIATLTSLVLSAPAPWRWGLKGLAHFLPVFLWKSALGSLDVARRALHIRRPIDPALIDYPLRLPHQSARIFMANTVSLLPGTLSVELHENSLKVHVLDSNLPIKTDLQYLENLVARLFGINLARDHTATEVDCD